MAGNEVSREEDSFQEETEITEKQTPATLDSNFKKQDASCQDSGEATQSINQIPAIFDAKNRSALIQIIKKLDPSSFVKLAKTCHEMHQICFHSNDVRVTFGDLKVAVSDLFWSRTPIVVFERLNKYPSRFTVLESTTNRRRIHENYPFVFICEELDLPESADSIVRAVFEDLGIQKVLNVVTSLPSESDWSDFSLFLQDFHVESVTLCDEGVVYRDETVLKLLVKSNLKKITFHCDLPDDVILEATVPHLAIRRMELSEEMFKALVLKFAYSSEDMSLKLHKGIGWFNESDVEYEMDEDGECDEDDDFEEDDSPFFEHEPPSPFHFDHYDLFKIIPCAPFDYDGPIPDKRPVIFMYETHPGFWILRNDGKYVHLNEMIHYHGDGHADYHSLKISVIEGNFPTPCFFLLEFPFNISPFVFA